MLNKKLYIMVVAVCLAVVCLIMTSTTQGQKMEALSESVAEHDHDHETELAEAETEAEHDEHAGESEAHEEELLFLTEQEKANIGLKTAIAGPGEIETKVQAPGEVRLNRDGLVYVNSLVEGIVSQSKVKVGDEVKAGTPLLVLQSRELAELRAEYLAASALVQAADKVYERENKLWQDKLNSESDLLASEQELGQARIALRLAGQKIMSLGIKQLPPASDDNLLDYEIVSPAAGTVLEKNINTGEIIGQQTGPAIVIADLSSFWVDIYLTIRQISPVKVGQKVLIYSEMNDTPGQAEISYISPVLDSQMKTVQVRAVLDNAAGLYRAGEYIQAEIITGHEDKAIVIEAGAVQSMTDGKYVFVTDEGGYKLMAVTLGAENAGKVEVVSGLAAGDEYVTEGAFALKSKLLTSTLDSHAGHGH